MVMIMVATRNTKHKSSVGMAGVRNQFGVVVVGVDEPDGTVFEIGEKFGVLGLV